MGDFSTYQISNFILFSREVYEGLLETYNSEIWPAQIVWLLISVLLLFLLKRENSRAITLLLAAAWIWTGWVFQKKYFSSINWAAQYFSWLFFIEACLLFVFGMASPQLHWESSSGFRNFFGISLFSLSAFFPWQVLLGKPSSQVLLFGWGPTETAIGTLGLLFFFHGIGWRLLLSIVPVIWLLIAFAISKGIR